MSWDFILFLVFAVGSTYIIKSIYYYKLKNNFSKSYGIGYLPKSIKVRKNTNKNIRNYYNLKYPHWYVSKKDGTADRRVKGNYIIWDRSNLYIENYLVFSKRPDDLLKVVKKLRLNGIKIDLCKEEKIKYENILKRKEIFANNCDIQRIIDFYAEKPTKFESLCAKLFESLGYATKLTPPSNDGGYDILLSKGKEQSIVECKCYSIGHKVGRPSIQKLVGANNIVLAEEMIFITTSDFSTGAISYADDTGVKLINGNTLMDLLNKQGFIEKERIEIDLTDYQLETLDLYPYVPSDIYEMFF